MTEEEIDILVTALKEDRLNHREDHKSIDRLVDKLTRSSAVQEAAERGRYS